jgi:hypothetical protein
MEEEINLLSAITNFRKSEIIRIRQKLKDKEMLTQIILDADSIGITYEQLISFIQRTNEYLNNS